ARVAGRNGETLAFRRLKRRSATLVDPDSGDVLSDDCLIPFIGAHDRQAFLEIFGLDQARLRDGGRKLLA
uniref:AAA family ATPase n=1 Tax=Proteus mirabilis TaxID=584 RepID=UPI0013D8D224